MAKSSIPTNIAMASRCAAKVKAGRACSMAELRATVMLLQTGLNASRSATRVAKAQVAEKAGMVRDLLSRIMR